MDYITVLYSLRNNAFKVEAQNQTYNFPERVWNDFLDEHGTNLKSDGKRLSGTDQIDKATFERLLEVN